MGDGSLRKALKSDEDGLRLTDFADRQPGRIEEYADADKFEDLPDCPIDILVGEVGGDAANNFYQPLGWGRMYSAGTPDPYPGEPWALDNGAWSAWSQGDAENFPEEKFIERVEEAREIAKEKETPPIFAVTPDKVVEGDDSLAFSLYWRGRIHELGWDDWNWYLAVQPQMKEREVSRALNYFDGIFLGGGKETKPAARRWKRLADEKGLPFHYGQCGTPDKVDHAFELGVDSIDSAGPRQTRYQFRKFLLRYAMLVEHHFGD